MPVFRNVDVEICVNPRESRESETFKADVEFEVFCGHCGGGLCFESHSRSSYGRGMPQVTVNPCPTCFDKLIDEKNSEIDDLKSIIQQLEIDL